jgi:LysR family hca operon transcriptional activator
MNIELRHLRYFVAVAEEASFTAAARRVHVAQQVLGSQIRQLEDAVGVRLLERTSRGAGLTAAGVSFLDGARATLAALDRTVAATRNSAYTLSGVLSVGLNVAAGGELPTTLLAAFQRACPQVEVKLRTFELTQPAAGLLARSTAVAFVRPPVCVPGLELESLAEEPRVFVLPAAHPLARRDRLALGDAGRADDARPAVRRFVEVVTTAAREIQDS